MSHKLFTNKKCVYFPCHAAPADGEFNCLFCYCPLYGYDNCPGNPMYVWSEEKQVFIKDCQLCTYVHEGKESWDRVQEFLAKNREKR